MAALFLSASSPVFFSLQDLIFFHLIVSREALGL